MNTRITRKNSSSSLFVRAAIGGLIAISAVAFAPPTASPAFAVPFDFFQAANLGPPEGDIDWIGSILQAQNSIYAEGMSVPQRMVFTAVPPTGNNQHTFTFRTQCTKGGGLHAYDFLTSWDQAITAAEGKGTNGADLLFSLADPNVVVLPASSQGATQAQMNSLWQPAQNPVAVEGDITPDNMPNVGAGTGNVAAQITAYEADPSLGNRTVTVRAPAGKSVTNVGCAFTGYSSAGGDNYAEYSLTWTSDSTLIGMEFAGHLGVGTSDGIVPGYGAGFGASDVSGGPYHFKVGDLDGISLGSVDNQIKGADIIIPCDDASATDPPDQTVCSGTSVSFTTVASGTGPFTYAWTFNGAPVGTNSATLNLGVVDETDEGTYCVSVTGNCGPAAQQCATLTVNDLTSTTDPPNQTVCSGTSVSFTTVASGTAPFTYAWTFNGAPIGTNSPTLNLGVVDETDEGTYCVSVTGACGPPAQQCATLTVNDATSTTDPPDQTVCTGATVSFTTVASGTAPFTYAWTFNGAPIGTNSPTLNLGAVDDTDEGTYCVSVTGACGPPAQQCATLDVNAAISTTDPPDKTVCTGDSVSFTTTASGTGPFTYVWTFNGAPIGTNSPTLNLGVVDAGDEGTYCVTVTGGCGPPVQQCATLTVNDAVSTTDPPNQTVCTGTSVSFTTVASGTGPFTYVWTFNGNPIGTNSPTLNLGVVDETDEGTYCVSVTGGCGSPAQQCATLTVNDAVSTTDPPDQTVCAGASVSFTTVASGTGPFTYAWTFNGAPIGTNSATLNLGVVDSGDEGTYCVTVTGGCGPPAQQCATLTVNDEVRATDPPDESVCEGETVSFTTSASGSGPFTYAWTFNGAPIGTNSPTLNLGAVDESDEGTYCVTVTGSCGLPAEQCATLTVNPNTVASDLLNVTVCPGEDVRFSTNASGSGTLTYVWTKDGVVIPGENTNSLDLTDVTLDDAGTYCVTVTGDCGPPVEKCARLEVMICNQVFCTFTQGFWGNNGGKFNGLSKQQLFTQAPYNLMATDLVVGVKGTRSLTFLKNSIPPPPGSWNCIIARLPAGGTPSALPDFNDQTMGPAPDCSVPGLPVKNGKFVNVLLGQVITLSLNTRFDTDLPDLELCNLMTTAAVDPGPDGLIHTDDDTPIPGTEKTVFISPTVMNALTNEGLPQTVGGLLALANRALAGLSTGGASVSSINGAVDAINQGFDTCRFLLSCESL